MENSIIKTNFQILSLYLTLLDQQARQKHLTYQVLVWK